MKTIQVVKYRDGGVRQPIAASYPVNQVKEAAAHAVKAAGFF